MLEPVDEALWILAKPTWKLITLANGRNSRITRDNPEQMNRAEVYGFKGVSKQDIQAMDSWRLHVQSRGEIYRSSLHGGVGFRVNSISTGASIKHLKSSLQGVLDST